MNIPDEVKNAALDEFERVAARSTVGRAVPASWQVIAEWARKEALREAADEAARSGGEWIDAWQPNAKMRPIEECIAEDIRALAEQVKA